jgi:hypothetical protein
MAHGRTTGDVKRSSTALGERPTAVEEQQLRELALAGCTDEEVAAELNVPVTQLCEAYGATLDRLRLVGNSIVRRCIWEKAISDNEVALLRLLAASRCGISSDPQLRELRALQIEEQRLKLERARLQLAQQQAEAAQRQEQRLQENQPAAAEASPVASNSVVADQGRLLPRKRVGSSHGPTATSTSNSVASAQDLIGKSDQAKGSTRQ